MPVPENTVRVAVLLAGPVGASAVLTPEVVFGYVPGVALITLNETVQLVFARIVIPLKLNKPVAPEEIVFPPAPVQVPVTAPGPPTALRLPASVSVKEAFVKSKLLGFVSVNVTIEVPVV